VKRKNDQPKDAYSGPLFAVGETVLISRPNIWAGASGTVVFVVNGVHRIKIDTKSDGTNCVCHADVPGVQLEAFI
jgi:phosphotransferase system IIA component